MAYSYWREAAEYALDAVGVEVTAEQLDAIGKSLEISAENQGLATGAHCIPNPLASDIRALEARHQAEINEWKESDRVFRENIAARCGSHIEARQVIVHNGRVDFLRQ